MGAAACVMMVVAVLGGGAVEAAAQSARHRYHAIEAGRLRPLFLAGAPDSGVLIPGFRLAQHAVSNAEFLQFVRRHPEWRRSNVPRIAADPSYLRHWANDTTLGAHALPGAPVVNVSWFAAQAYATSVGARLPTTMEWELAASRVPSAARVRRGDAPMELLDGPWEWVEDFNSVVTSGESRGDSGPDDALFCAGGAALSADPSNYGAFMRHALRGSLRGSYALENLGFRLARDASPTHGAIPR